MGRHASFPGPAAPLRAPAVTHRIPSFRRATARADADRSLCRIADQMADLMVLHHACLGDGPERARRERDALASLITEAQIAVARLNEIAEG